MELTIKKLVQMALDEDIPQKDITTDSFHKDLTQKAKLIAKQDLILSGLDFFIMSFKHLNPQVELNSFFKDGDSIPKGSVVCEVMGDSKKMLQAERVGLNFLGRLSGIATATHQLQKLISHTKCKITDTRKTSPLLRVYEKKAVRDGGGVNHRMNLSTGYMIKENHFAFGNNDLVKTLKSVLEHQSQHPDTPPITIEVTNLDQLNEVVKWPVQRVMLDNWDDDKLSETCELIPQTMQIEASGNMTAQRIPKVAESGVQFISVGALTHSVMNADFSLLFDNAIT